MNRRKVGLILAAVIIVAGAMGYALLSPGVDVSVRNTGKEPLREVTIHVTGRSYTLGDLAPGSLRTRNVSPRGESSVEVEFANEHGKRIRLSAGGYLEPGYGGRIVIEIRDGNVIAVKDEVRISRY